jgi:hypothetical protein
VRRAQEQRSVISTGQGVKRPVVVVSANIGLPSSQPKEKGRRRPVSLDPSSFGTLDTGTLRRGAPAFWCGTGYSAASMIGFTDT